MESLTPSNSVEIFLKFLAKELRTYTPQQFRERVCPLFLARFSVTFFFTNSVLCFLVSVTSVYELGCFAGAIFAFFFGERLGRRKMIFCMSFHSIIKQIDSNTPCFSVGSFVMCIGTTIQVRTNSLGILSIERSETDL